MPSLSCLSPPSARCSLCRLTRSPRHSRKAPRTASGQRSCSPADSRSSARKGAHGNRSCRRSARARESCCAGRTASASSTCTSACPSTARVFLKGCETAASPSFRIAGRHALRSPRWGALAFLTYVSVGNAAVLDVADYLEYLADDSETKAAALFIETLRDPAAFARAMRAMHEAGKPVVALKVGRSAKGAAASAAHTGSLAGNWEAYQAYFRRHGVIAVDDFDELAESVELALKVRAPPLGDGVAIIAVSGGEASLVADLAERSDVRLPELAPETVTRLRTVLPAFGSIGNPLDTTDRGVYDSQNVYSGSIRALADDPSVSLIAVVQDCSPGLSARGANNYRRIAQTVADAAREIAKPVVFFNTAAGGMHAHVIEPFAGSSVAVMQGARASLLAIGRLLVHARFAP
ncbi:MAG: hypothetical protein E6G91_18565, partial [Alphaproteobacteria bacterium]